MFFFMAVMLANAFAFQPAHDTPTVDPFGEQASCPETPMSIARKIGKDPLRATPLTELPGGQMFMAVDRRIDGCSAPMTAGEYRRAR